MYGPAPTSTSPNIGQEMKVDGWTLCEAHTQSRCEYCSALFHPGTMIWWRPGHARHAICPDNGASATAQATNAASAQSPLFHTSTNPSFMLPDGFYSIAVPGMPQPISLGVERPQNGPMKDKTILSYFTGTDPSNPMHYTGYAFVNGARSAHIWRKFQIPGPLLDLLNFATTSLLQGAYIGGPNG